MGPEQDQGDKGGRLEEACSGPARGAATLGKGVGPCLCGSAAL